MGSFSPSNRQITAGNPNTSPSKSEGEKKQRLRPAIKRIGPHL